MTSPDVYPEGQGPSFVVKFITTHINLATGDEYQLLHITNEAATSPGWKNQAVYADGKNIWSRPLTEFNDPYTPK